MSVLDGWDQYINPEARNYQLEEIDVRIAELESSGNDDFVWLAWHARAKVSKDPQDYQRAIENVRQSKAYKLLGTSRNECTLGERKPALRHQQPREFLSGVVTFMNGPEKSVEEFLRGWSFKIALLFSENASINSRNDVQLYLELLREALRVGHDALELISDDDAPGLYLLLTNAHMRLYIRTHELSNLRDALEISEKGLRFIDDQRVTGQIAAELLHGRANVLFMQAESYTKLISPRENEIRKNIKEAISLVHQALELINDDTSASSLRATLFTSLATLNKELSTITKDPDQKKHLLNEMMRLIDSVGEMDTTTHRPELHNLKVSGLLRMIQLHESSEAEHRCQELLDQSVSDFFETHEKNLLPYHYNYHTQLLTIAEVLHFKDRLKDAIHLLSQGANNTSAIPECRMWLAIVSGRLAMRISDWESADRMFQIATSQLRVGNTNSMTSEDHYTFMGGLHGMGCDAAYTALQRQHSAVEALRRLEKTRCSVAEISTRGRRNISELHAKHPDLAVQYDKLRDELTRNFRSQNIYSDFRDTLRFRPETLEKIEQLEAKIRKLDGFENFLQTITKETEFLDLAKDGPIITFIFASETSGKDSAGHTISGINSAGYAIIVGKKSIRSIELHSLTLREVQMNLRPFTTAAEQRGRNNEERNVVPWKSGLTTISIEEALNFLWLNAVKPVLQNLEQNLEWEETSTRRVWWVTSGIMGRAPLHAAGDHSPGSIENTASHVVSSYISSFKALKYARECAGKPIDPKLLLITMAKNKPHLKSLNTKPEQDATREAFGDGLTVEEGPTPEHILSVISNFSMVHFACHGFSSQHNPMESGLVLKESNEHADGILTVKHLEDIDLERGHIAYLSCCSTAEIGQSKLEDEGIHLANSFQVLGYPNVIGTLWKANDHAAGQIAKKFYESLQKSNIPEMSGEEFIPAIALHHAMLEYKKEKGFGASEVLQWGPFIHIGV